MEKKTGIYLYSSVNNEFIHLWWIDISPDLENHPCCFLIIYSRTTHASYSFYVYKNLRKRKEPRINNVTVENLINSKMVKIFLGSDFEELIQCMFANIKTQIKNPGLPKSGFTQFRIMHLDINFETALMDNS